MAAVFTSSLVHLQKVTKQDSDYIHNKANHTEVAYMLKFK